MDEAMMEARQAGLEAHMRYFGKDIPKGGAIAFLDGLDAFLASLSKTCAILPREPTEAMVRAAQDVEISPSRIDGGCGAPDLGEVKAMIREIYRAMLAATEKE